MKVYIAGPLETQGNLIQNIRNAIDAADMVLALGHAPFIPHISAFWHMIYPHPYNIWIKYDLEFLAICDAVLRLPGESNGADIEVKKARELGIPVYHTVEDLPK